MEPVLVKYLSDDRKVEIIDGWLCLEGRPEVRELVVLDEHPNRQAILKAVPKATHMAGRIPLTMPEASVAQAALRRAHDTFDGSAHAVTERMRHAVWQKVFADGAD
ncbi:conserved hypothetical protein [Leptothrix cholodnii SP-6]|uniref:Uncharacterized protein n=1 Tax=Leptothrix cholodnii (strain ATCC 51168 / LMG 8142 / SP-6) TaxID=395495 RepID=B1Y774_LEPCP|nr:hypothetical protein [Leptothrix cholodnii]ACB33701.1 conserved hypothetical protein [Leptothrix cholodnii SP-6]